MQARTLAKICLQNPNKSIRILDLDANNEYELEWVSSNNFNVYLCPKPTHKKVGFLARIFRRKSTQLIAKSKE